MESMRTAQSEYHNWGDEKDPTSDWNLLLGNATFTHKTACEFIIYIGDDTTPEYSSELMELIQNAKKRRYKYLCIYA